MTIPEAAVEAAAKKVAKYFGCGEENCGGCRFEATDILKAAMPHIREDIAKGLQEIGEVWYEFDEETAAGLRYAAEIVRQTD